MPETYAQSQMYSISAGRTAPAIKPPTSTTAAAVYRAFTTPPTVLHTRALPLFRTIFARQSGR